MLPTLVLWHHIVLSDNFCSLFVNCHFYFVIIYVSLILYVIYVVLASFHLIAFLLFVFICICLNKCLKYCFYYTQSQGRSYYEYLEHICSNFIVTLGSVVLHLQRRSQLEQQQGIHPQFVQKPTIRHAGEKIIIECQLLADPLPSIIWMFNKRLLVSKGRIFIDMRSEDHVHLIVLEISNVTLQDSGEYRAVAKNAVGEAEATITLNVEGEGLCLSPRVKLLFPTL